MNSAAERAKCDLSDIDSPLGENCCHRQFMYQIRTHIWYGYMIPLGPKTAPLRAYSTETKKKPFWKILVGYPQRERRVHL